MADVAHTSDGLPRPNGGPAAPPRNFKKAWAAALFATPEKPTGAVAMAFRLYLAMDAQGEGAAVSDLDFMMSCGVSDGAVRKFKHWLVNNGFIVIVARGYRGHTSRFRAVIPGKQMASPRDAISEAVAEAIVAESNIAGFEIAAPNAGNHSPEYRHAMRANENQMPASGDGIPELASPNAAIPAASRAPAHATKESPSEILDTKQITTTTTATVEQEASVGSGPLAAMNGHGVELLKLLRKSIPTLHSDEEAIAQLQSDVDAYGADLMLEALVLTRDAMRRPEKRIQDGWRYLLRTAGEIKHNRTAEAGASRATPKVAQARSAQRDNAMAALERAAAKEAAKGNRK